MKKNWYLVVDTETTMKGHVADFGAVLIDKRGFIVSQCAVLISEFFDKEPLFYSKDAGVFGKTNLHKRTQAYYDMVSDGERIIRPYEAVNNWLIEAEKFTPILVAYNLAFDMRACRFSGIKLPTGKTLCLWKECSAIFAQRRAYTKFCLENKLLTPALNLSTSAETMYKYLSGDVGYIEPHTAIADLKTCELFILNYLLRQKRKIQHKPYNWREHRLIDKVHVI